MKRLHITNYKLYNENAKKDIRICIINDIHFSSFLKNEYLYKIIELISALKPDYILCPGDIIDCHNEIRENKDLQRLVNFFRRLASIGIVIASIGNHDQYKLDESVKKKKWLYESPKKLVDELNKIPNVYVLDNDSFLDENIFVFGFTESFNYYNRRENPSPSIFKPAWENKEVLIEELKSIKDKITNVRENKINILLAHSPVYLKDEEISEYLSQFILIISGHMHNGCVPPILYEIWDSDRGIIGPGKMLLPKNERNTLRRKSDKLLVNGPIVTLQKCSGFMKNFDFLYPGYISLVDFTSDPTYDREKIFINKKYYK